MKTFRNTFCALAMTVLVAACGNTSGERALSGAGVGVAAGGLTGALAGGSGVTGAVIGGAAGAAIGGLTDRDDISLD